MTRNAARKNQARAYQAAHPGTTYPAAAKATRRHADQSAAPVPTMTVEELKALIASWPDENLQIADALEQLSGGTWRPPFERGAPIPTCPTCGWESEVEGQTDFTIEPSAAHPLGAHIRFGCGHTWTITTT